jgi:hypothetical protein
MLMPAPKRWEHRAWLAIAVGLYWLLVAGGDSWLLWAIVPGALLLAAGVALLLLPGDPRTTQYMALGGVLGVLLAVGAALTASFGAALLAALGSAACFVVAGRIALEMEPQYDGAPAIEMSPQMDARAALDEALLGYFLASARMPGGAEGERLCADAFKLEEALQSLGGLQDPGLFHAQPPAPSDIDSSTHRIYGSNYEELSWDSGYAPDELLPGAAVWRSYRENNQACVRVLRHPGKPRPWLLCIHGYRMGAAWMDLGLFTPKWLHHALGLNIVQPVLPLHGPRRIGLRSGDGYLDGDLLNLVHAQSNALWDLRRTIAWIRHQEEQPRIGVYGVSLGGYNASLLASYEADLDFIVAGIPLVDFATATWRFMPPAHLRYFESLGMNEARYREILRVVSPLARPPLLAPEKLLIFAGTADRLVVPQQPLSLAQHWNTAITWYQGGHLGLRRAPETAETIREAILRAGWPAFDSAV